MASSSFSMCFSLFFFFVNDDDDDDLADDDDDDLAGPTWHVRTAKQISCKGAPTSTCNS